MDRTASGRGGASASKDGPPRPAAGTWPPRTAAVARSLDEFPVTPWRNGAGVTRQIAVGTDGGAAGEELWRVSVAELDGDAAFSDFPGWDRRFVLASDDRIALRINGSSRRLSRGMSIGFPGEADVTAGLDGRPARALNLMTRRWRADGNVRVRRRSGRATIAHPFVRVVMLLDGAARLVDGPALARHGLVLPGSRGMVLECSGATLAAVFVRTHPEP